MIYSCYWSLALYVLLRMETSFLLLASTVVVLDFHRSLVYFLWDLLLGFLTDFFFFWYLDTRVVCWPCRCGLSLLYILCMKYLNRNLSVFKQNFTFSEYFLYSIKARSEFIAFDYYFLFCSILRVLLNSVTKGLSCNSVERWWRHCLMKVQVCELLC